MLRRALFVAIGMVSVFTAIAANASGSFDGKWVGTAPAPAVGDCGILTVTMTVLDGKVVSGTVSGKHGTPSIDWGFVQPNGWGKVQYSTQPTFTAELTFVENVFTGWFPSVCGKRAVSGSRAQ